MNSFFNISEERLTDEEKVNVLEVWAKKLSINPSELNVTGVLKPIEETGFLYRTASVSWNSQRKCWDLTFYQLADEKALIHELGHITLEKVLNFRLSENSIDLKIFFCIDQLIDCFNDYRLSKFPEYYLLLKKIRIMDLSKKPSLNEEIIVYIGFYLFYYIELNFVLKSEDKNQSSPKIKNLLIILKNLIKKKSKHRNKDIDSKKIENLTKVLKTFEVLKDSNNFKDIKVFILNVLSEIGLWEKLYIHQQLDIVFSLCSY